MEKVKPEVSRIMRDNRQTKIKMILSCKMVREYENGSVQLQDSFFHTKVIENLRATDESQPRSGRFWMERVHGKS